MNEVDEALAKSDEWSMRKLALGLDQTGMKQRSRAANNGDGGSVLRGEEVPVGEVDEAEAGEYQGD